MKPEENIRRLVKRSDVTTGSEVDERILGDALDGLEKLRQGRYPGAEAGFWRTIMRSRIIKLAAALAIVTAVLITIYKSGGSIEGVGVVWAEVANKIEQVPTHKYRERRIVTCEGKEVDFLRSDVIKYVSPEYGYREDMYHQSGVLMHQIYVLRAQKVSITVIPVLKQYKIKELTEAEGRIFEMRFEQIIEQIKSGQYTELGRKTIDGIEVEGIEFSDRMLLAESGYPIKFDNVVIHLWAGIRTSLPVQFDAVATTSDKYITNWTGGKPVDVKATDYEFQWNVQLDQNVFEPNITDDYTLISEETDSYDEEKAINGLQIFAQLAEGRYPSELNMMTIMREACQVIQELMSSESDEAANQREQKMKQIIVATKPTCLFFNRLVKDEKDVAYCGDTVTADDMKAVLVRWKVSGSEYRVVFGDLTTKNVGAEDLAELENMSLE